MYRQPKLSRRRNNSILLFIIIVAILLFTLLDIILILNVLSTNKKPNSTNVEYVNVQKTPLAQLVQDETIAKVSEAFLIVNEAETIVKLAVMTEQRAEEAETIANSVTTVAELTNVKASIEEMEAIIAEATTDAMVIDAEADVHTEEVEMYAQKAIKATSNASNAVKDASIVVDNKMHLITTIAKVIYVEARGEPMSGKIAVGATIMNRLKSDRFPNELEEVLMGQYASYSWVTDKNLEAVPECIVAAERAVNGEDPLAKQLGEPTVYFLNPTTAVQTEVKFRQANKNVSIGNHLFNGISLYWE